jgi:hypothetical protein
MSEAPAVSSFGKDCCMTMTPPGRGGAIARVLIDS